MKEQENEEAGNELEAYWSQRYMDESTGWDLGEASRPITEYIDQLENKDLDILIPGAGNAYEAEYLFRAGFRNTYILDISALPLQNFQKRVPDFPKEQLIQGDFFTLDRKFDLILEQTFFCSFPPIDHNRERYVEQMHRLLKPGGKLVGLWFNFPLTDDLTKRPFGGSKSQYEALLSTHFKAKTFEESTNSIADRAGKELFGIWQRK